MENKKTAGPAGTNLEMENKKIGYLKPTNFVIFLIFDQGVYMSVIFSLMVKEMHFLRGLGALSTTHITSVVRLEI